jgi:acyl carrier protein
LIIIILIIKQKTDLGEVGKMDIFNRLTSVIKREFPGIKDIDMTKTSSFLELGLDSVGFMTLIVCIEEEFEINFTDDFIVNVTSVNDIYNYLVDNLSD